MASVEDTSSITARLTAQHGAIEKIAHIAGVAGASIGIIHHGKVVHTKHFGYRDVEKKQKADVDTMYGIGSCSKSYFVAAAAALVEQGKLSWTEPAKKVVPEFKTSSEVVTEQANIIDLAAHRLGLTGAFHLTFQGDGSHLIEKQDSWTYLSKLQLVASFRVKWLYNSHGYSVLGEMLKRVTGQPVSEVLQDYVAKPLGLTHTVSKLSFDEAPNFARPCTALADGTPYELPYRQDFWGHFFEAAAGIYTSLDDVLKYSNAVLRAASQLPDAAYGPIRESAQLFTQHIPVANPSIREESYALGWIRTQLPGAVGVMGDNGRILPVPQLPVLGRGATPRLALYHQGATVGYFTSFYVFPETESAVIILTNSIANCDAADWIAQVMIQALFDDQQPVDFAAQTKKYTRTCLQAYTNMQDIVQQNRQSGPPPHSLDEYSGDYYDATGIFFVHLRRNPDEERSLQLLFQG